jgi:hypothetical protein
MQESTKHKVENPPIEQIPYQERLKGLKSYPWEDLTTAVQRLVYQGEPYCQIVDHVNRMAACGEFGPCMQFGASHTSSHNTECAESTSSPEIARVTPGGGVDFTGTLRLFSNKGQSGQ